MSVTGSEKGDKVVALFNKLVTVRNPLDQNWKEAFAYTFPHRGQLFNGNVRDGNSNAHSAKQNIADIFDSTATTSVRLLASSMISGLTPGNSQWFTLQVPNTVHEQLDSAARKWLEDASISLFKMIHSSNYNAETFEFFEDVSVGGMAGLYIEKEHQGQFKFKLWPMEGLYCQSTLGDGRIDTVLRNISYTALEARNVFGADNLPDEINTAFDTDPNSQTQYDFIHCIRPRMKKNGKQANGVTTNNLPWESIYVCRKSMKVVKESGYHEWPVPIPRWSVIPSTDYAVGPINTCLPDIKSVNKLSKNLLLSTDMNISPPMVVQSDGLLNPQTTKVGPRQLVFAANVNNIKPLVNGSNYTVGREEIERIQSQIRAAMMADELSPISKKYASATEVSERSQIIRQILGPVYARLQSEYLYPLIERCFGLALRDGSLGIIPKSIQDITPEYQSPLAMAQKQEQIRQMDQFEQGLAATAQLQPAVLDLYDFDNAQRRKATLGGVPVDLIRTNGKVAELRDAQRKEMEQAANDESIELQSAN